MRCQGTPTRWTPSQAAAFLQTNHGTYGDQLARAFEVLLGAGMRRRELPGLHWPKVHPAEQMLLVRWNLTAVDNNHLHLGHPKTKASRHWISLSARVVSALERQAAAARASLPEHAPLEGLVFCQPDGAPLRPQQLLVTLRQVDGDRSPPDRCARSAAHGRQQHGQLGRPLAVVSKTLRHSTLSTTVNIYGHCSVLGTSSPFSLRPLA